MQCNVMQCNAVQCNQQRVQHLVKVDWKGWLGCCMYNLVTHSVMQCNAMSQCLAEHNVYNALHCRYMKQDGCFQWCTMYTIQIHNVHCRDIEVGATLLCPCTLTDPDSWQLSTSTPTSCPSTPQPWPKDGNIFWTNWHLRDLSHLPCKACAIWIFCPLSHWHPRQVKTCQPGQLR